jgi:hypothetical protein
MTIISQIGDANDPVKSSILGSKMSPIGSLQLKKNKSQVATLLQIDSRKREAMPTIVDTCRWSRSHNIF